MRSKDVQHDPRILALLQAKTLYLVDSLPAHDGQWVIFEEKGKIKLGILSNRYYHRYGISTRATLKPGSKFPWVQSKDMLDSERYRPLLEMMIDGSYKSLPVFDVTTLDFIGD